MSLSIYFSFLNLESIGVTKYVIDYIPRLFLFMTIYLVLFFIFVKRRYFKDFNNVFVLFLLTSSMLFDTLGNFLGWYDFDGILKILWFDDIIHLFSPILISAGLIWYFYFIKEYRKSKAIVLGSTICFLLVILWEVHEYISDTFLGIEMIRGVDDTIWDILFGILGILIISIFFKRYLKRV